MRMGGNHIVDVSQEELYVASVACIGQNRVLHPTLTGIYRVIVGS